ncbi:hypothetical protein D7M10_19520 [Pseudomonas fluorescens]|nr:hypothetical protein D7M10_19520 [Pseudomonas fluorescens]
MERTYQALAWLSSRTQNPCRSGLACDAGTAVYQEDRGDAIAGKPAPTQSSVPEDIGLRAR